MPMEWRESRREETAGGSGKEEARVPVPYIRDGGC